MSNLIKNQLANMPFGDLFAFFVENEVIDGFGYETQGDGTLIIKLKNDDGTYTVYGPESQRYDFIINEGVSRLASLPHIKQFAEKRFANPKVYPRYHIQAARYDENFDFVLFGFDENEKGEMGLKMYIIECKCRDGKYTKEYFENNGVMVDKTKLQTRITTLYTQSSDGFGYFFNIDGYAKTDVKYANRTTVGNNGEKIQKELLFFNVSDAIDVEDPFESKTISDYMNDYEN